MWLANASAHLRESLRTCLQLTFDFDGDFLLTSIVAPLGLTGIGNSLATIVLRDVRRPSQ